MFDLFSMIEFKWTPINALQYILRLAMIHRNGGYLYRSVNVTINNTVPTPTVGASAGNSSV